MSKHKKANPQGCLSRESGNPEKINISGDKELSSHRKRWGTMNSGDASASYLLPLILSILLVIIVLPDTGHAIAGLGFGVRTGFAFDFDHPQLKKEGDHPNLEPPDLTMLGAHLTLFALRKVSVELAGEYSYRDYQREVPLINKTVDFEVRDYAAYATGRYKLVQKKLGLHLGGGVNVHRFTYSKGVQDIRIEIPDNDWHAGFHILAGISFKTPVLPFRIFTEARITKINIEGDAAQQAMVLAGVTFGSF